MSDDERDSLFGSPPPSPSLRGRSPCAALALPGTRTGKSAASAANIENVGTTALFGLHQIFDIPESSASSDSSLVTGWPPAHSSQKSVRNPLSERQVRPPCPPRARSQQLLAERPSRPLAEPLDLPASVEEGTNHLLLRSHPSLLGRAGSVAHMKAARLPRPGSSALDPIVIEDESRVPEMQSQRFKPRFIASTPMPRSSASTISPTPATAKEILAKAAAQHVAIAIKQNPQFKRILDDLNAIANFVNDPSGQKPPKKTAPPTKRRKTTRGHVPAGAEYWTVPFPFSEGEAPEEYTSEWKKANIKRLLADLINLINATHKNIMGSRLAKRRNPLTLPNMKLERARTGSPAVSQISQKEMSEPATTSDIILDPMLDGASFSSAVGLDDLLKILKDYDNTPPQQIEDSSLNQEGEATTFPSFVDGSQAEIFPSMFDQLLGDPLYQSFLGNIPGDLAYTGMDYDRFDLTNFDFHDFSTTGTEDTERDTQATLSPTSSYGLLPTPTTYTPADSPMMCPQPELDAFSAVQADQHETTGECFFLPGFQSSVEPPPYTHPLPLSLPDFTPVSPPEVLTPAPPPVRQPLVSRKHEALEKAKALRQQTLEQIRETRTELWEYTIESGVIGNIQLIM